MSIRRASIVHAALFTPSANGGMGLPIYCEGSPGTAKTSYLRAYARRLVSKRAQQAQDVAKHFPCEVLSPGGRGDAAFGVVPVPAQYEGDAATYLVDPSPGWTRPFTQLGFGVLIVDEFTTAAPLIQAAILSILTERYISGCTLPPRVRIIAAGNPVGQAAGGYDPCAALANRVSRIAWPTPSPEELRAYLGRAILSPTSIVEEEPIDADSEEDRVLRMWPSVAPSVLGVHAAFMAAQPNYVTNPREDGQPFASPRTWDLFVRALIGAKIHGLTEEETDALAGGFVGNEALQAYRTFEEQADLPNVRNVLEEKEVFEHNPRRADRTAAFVFAASEHLKQSKDKLHASVLYKLLEGLPALSFDLVAPAILDLYKSGLANVPGAEKLSQRIYAFEKRSA